MARLNRRRPRRVRHQTEISLTPLIDTALTLLIIFMISTPMLRNAIRVNVPEVKGEKVVESGKPHVISVNERGEVYFNDQLVQLSEIGTLLKKGTNAQDAQGVWIHIDQERSCQLLLDVIEQVKYIGGIKDVKVATRLHARSA